MRRQSLDQLVCSTEWAVKAPRTDLFKFSFQRVSPVVPLPLTAMKTPPAPSGTPLGKGFGKGATRSPEDSRQVFLKYFSSMIHPSLPAFSLSLSLSKCASFSALSSLSPSLPPSCLCLSLLVSLSLLASIFVEPILQSLSLNLSISMCLSLEASASLFL